MASRRALPAARLGTGEPKVLRWSDRQLAGVRWVVLALALWALWQALACRPHHTPAATMASEAVETSRPGS